MTDKPLTVHARIKELESALTALREEREQLLKENKELLTRRASEGDSPRQPAAPAVWRDSRGYTLPMYIAVVADEDGAGVQIEGHVKGQDWEIDVDTAGRLHGFLCVPPLEESQSADARLTPVVKGKASGSATEPDLRTAIAHLTEERNHWKRIAEEWRSELLVEVRKLAALTDVHERLRTLITEWSRRDRAEQRVNNGWTRGDYAQCAREIDALLSPREGTPQL